MLVRPVESDGEGHLVAAGRVELVVRGIGVGQVALAGVREYFGVVEAASA